MQTIAAVVLAAGRGSRMNSRCPKQYLEIDGRPLLYYSLRAFENSSVDKIILVVGKGEEQQRGEEIVKRYHFRKVTNIVAGGKERYLSVYEGLKAAGEADYVLIHDGARPMLTVALIQKAIQVVAEKKACAAAVFSKDSVKLTEEDGTITKTLERNCVRLVQTPQAFEYPLILSAYQKILREDRITVTDDTEVYEKATGRPAVLFEGDYHNIKVTTPEDLEVARLFLAHKEVI